MNTKVKDGAVWLKTPDACKALGVSRDTLRRRRMEGFLISGQHFLKTSQSRSGWYLWNLEEVQVVLGNWKAPRASGGRRCRGAAGHQRARIGASAHGHAWPRR